MIDKRYSSATSYARFVPGRQPEASSGHVLPETAGNSCPCPSAATSVAFPRFQVLSGRPCDLADTKRIMRIQIRLMDLATIEKKVIMKKGYKIIGEKSMNE